MYLFFFFVFGKVSEASFGSEVGSEGSRRLWDSLNVAMLLFSWFGYQLLRVLALCSIFWACVTCGLIGRMGLVLWPTEWCSFVDFAVGLTRDLGFLFGAGTRFGVTIAALGESSVSRKENCSEVFVVPSA